MKRVRCSALGPLITLCCSLLTPVVAAAQDEAARNLVKSALEALPNVTFVASAKLTGDLRGERQFLVKHKVIGGERATYVEVVAPDFLVGMRFLFQERVDRPPVQHMRYIATSTPVLIANEMRAEPFLGSTFYLLDVVEPELSGFTYRFVGSATVGGRSCKLVESTPAEPEKQVYGKIVQAIEPKDFIVMSREFFDHDGKLLKKWTAEKVEKIDGHWTVRDQRMKNVQRDVESRLLLTEIKYGEEIADSVFTTEYLVR